MTGGFVDKLKHPFKATKDNAENTDSLHSPNKSGPVEELPAEDRVLGNPHHGNKHDAHPTAPEDRVEHPVGFGRPGYSEGNPGQGAAGAGGMKFTA